MPPNNANRMTTSLFEYVGASGFVNWLLETRFKYEHVMLESFMNYIGSKLRAMYSLFFNSRYVTRRVSLRAQIIQTRIMSSKISKEAPKGRFLYNRLL